MAIHSRLARLEARLGSSERDLRRIVLRGFQGDSKCMWHVCQRLRRAFGLDVPLSQARADPAGMVRSVAESDPELAAAIAAVPQRIKDALIEQAERQHGVPIAELGRRLEARRAAVAAQASTSEPCVAVSPTSSHIRGLR